MIIIAGGGRGLFSRGSIQAAPGPRSETTGSTSGTQDSIVTPLDQLHVAPGSHVSGGNGNGNGDAPGVGRGATRGRRDRQDFYPRTRPETCLTKQGTGGNIPNSNANCYFVICYLFC